MPPPAVYLDECIDKDLATRLRARGFHATTTYAEGMSGAADRLQLEFAAHRGWAIVSHNKRDYQYWHRAFSQQGRTHSGIIPLPQSPLPRLELRAAMTLDWIDQCNHPSAFGVSPGAIRVHNGRVGQGAPTATRLDGRGARAPSWRRLA